MLNGFPCPNPTCAHVFPTAAVTGAAALTCPRCGTVFQFRTGGAAPPPPRPPVARAPAAPPPLPRALPAALPAPSAPPRAMPAPAQPAAPHQLPTYERFDLDAMAAAQGTTGDGYRRSDGSGWWAFKVAVVMLLLGGGAVAGVYYAYQHDMFSKDNKTPDTGSVAFKPFRSDAYNYSFTCPRTDWRTDDDVTTALRGQHISLRRSEQPAGWMAIIVKDFKSAGPRDSDLEELLLSRLRERIPDVAHEVKAEEKVELGGKRAIHVLFQGTVNNVGKVDGEAYLMAHQGIGYAFVTWAPDEVWSKVFPQFDELRKGFTLLNPSAALAPTYGGASAPGGG